MKVIAVNYYRHDRNAINNVIVEMGVDDLKAILGKTYYDSPADIKPGVEVKIVERYRHAMTIEHRVNETPELPQKLRLLADMLDMHIPAIVALAEQGEE